MGDALYIGAVGMRAQQRALDAIANNIANMSTQAFKRSDVRFAELVAEGGGDHLGSLAGVRSEASARVFSQGDLKPTGSPMDLAINGEGLIELLGPGGTLLLWRGGPLRIDAEGRLTSAAGIPLKAMITVPREATGLSIAPDGVVRAKTGDGEDLVEIGRIDLVLPRDVSMLTSIGDGLYRDPDQIDLLTVQPGEEGAGVLVQGALEASNVQLTNEMVSLMLVQRAFAANAQVVQAGDQLLSIANGLKR